MQNIISENDENNKTLSSSSAASITEPIMKPQNGQTKKVSNSENLSTIKRPYGSMPNLTASITTDGDTAAVQAPTAFPIQQDDSDEPQNAQTKKVSTSDNLLTLKRPYGSMPNLTASITTDGDTAAVQVAIAVPVQEDVSAEPQKGQTKKVSTSDNLLTLKRRYGSMPNLTASITTGGDTAAFQAPIAVPGQEDVSAEPQKGQTKKVSTRDNLLTLKRPYGSMPNLTASITTDGDTASVQAPTAVPVQEDVSAEPLAEYCPKPIKLADYAGPQMRYYNGLVNAAAVMAPPAAVGEVDEIRSPSVISDRHISAEPKHDGSGESDAKTSRDFVGRPPRRLWRSMPNIALHSTDKVFYDATDIECITPMQVSRESLKIVIEPAGEVTPVKTKRCSLWKRARKFARRVFCCAAR